VGYPRGLKDGRKPPALRAGHLRNRHKAVSGVARLQVVEESSKAGPGEILGSLRIPLAIRAWVKVER
jgi:hypothetical protein